MTRLSFKDAAVIWSLRRFSDSLLKLQPQKWNSDETHDVIKA